MKAIKTLLPTVGAFTIFGAPVILYMAYVAITLEPTTEFANYKDPNDITGWLYAMSYTNSGMNSLIYAKNNSDFRKALKSYFLNICRKS